MRIRFRLAHLGWFAALFLLALVPPHLSRRTDGLVAESASPASKAGPASPAPKPPEFDVRQLLEDAKPASPERAWALVGELIARGQPGIARQITRPLRSKPEDNHRLVRALVLLGADEAALPLLEEWKRSSPNDPEPTWRQLASDAAAGRLDRARGSLQTLNSLRDKLTETDRQALLFVSDVIAFQMRRQPIGVDFNPWQVRFPVPAGASIPALPAAEAGKLPKNAEAMVGGWLRYRPLQGELWALLGQILCARGRLEDAEDCFRRAKVLNYQPAAVREYLYALGLARSAREKAALQSIAASPNAAPSTAADPSAGSVEFKESSTKVLATVGGAGLLLGLILGLQLRSWFGGGKKSARAT